MSSTSGGIGMLSRAFGNGKASLGRVSTVASVAATTKLLSICLSITMRLPSSGLLSPSSDAICPDRILRNRSALTGSDTHLSIVSSESLHQARNSWPARLFRSNNRGHGRRAENLETIGRSAWPGIPELRRSGGQCNRQPPLAGCPADAQERVRCDGRVRVSDAL